MKAALVIASLATGCAQIFGIDTTSGTTDGGTGAHIAFQRASIGAQVVMSPLDLTGQTATFLVADTTEPSGYRSVAGISDGSGGWNGDVPDGNPMIDFTWPPAVAGGTSSRQLWALPTRSVRSPVPAYADPDPEPAPATATLDLNITIPTFMMETFDLVAIGGWARYALTDTDVPPATTTTIATSIPASSLTALANPPIPRITMADRLMLLRYMGPELTGVFETSLDEMDGSNPVAGTLQPVTQDQMVSAAVDPTTLATRYTAVRPAVMTPVMNWEVLAAPGYQQLQLLGPELQGGPVAAADTTITTAFGNPFESYGWHAILAYATYETRSVMLPTGDSLSLSAGMSTDVEAGTGLTLDLPAGLPQTISIDEIPLSSDNMTVTLDPTKYPTISIVTDHPMNTVYELVLYEVVVVPMMPVTLRRAVEMLTTDPANLTLPPDALEVGHTYTIEAICYQGGYLDAATGDMLTRSLPVSSSYNYSGVFTVANP